MLAAAELGRAEWSELLVERNEQIGGFVAGGERTLPGYNHNTFSSWHPLFVTGAGYAALAKALHRHGLVYRNTDGAVTASIGRDGRSVVLYRDPARTALQFVHPEDRVA